LILQKSFQTFFLRFFTFFEKCKFISDVIKMRNSVNWKKNASEHKQKMKKMGFFGYFSEFFGFCPVQKSEKNEKMDRKKRASALFFKFFEITKHL
jgi:hypothetical protein